MEAKYDKNAVSCGFKNKRNFFLSLLSEKVSSFFSVSFQNQVATTSGFALSPDTLSAHELISTYSRVGFDEMSVSVIDIGDYIVIDLQRSV